MKATIVGVGQMGRATAWAMHKLGFDELVLADINQENLDKCEDLIDVKSSIWRRFINSAPTLSTHLLNMDYVDYSFIDRDTDIVISALPYHQNSELAENCIANGISYCDLGGNEGVSHGINENANRYKRCSIMTDLGLAPGWVNIIAENMYKDHITSGKRAPENITMMVGGLPQEPSNILKYSCTWSFDGLINEYRDDCAILRGGDRDTVRGMDGYEFPVVSEEIGALEAFYTSGGGSHTISTMKSRGVKNCCYKTLRYPGHLDIVKFLIRESGLSDDKLIDVFKHSCPAQDDLVIIKVKVGDASYEKVIRSNDQFSAMQMATTFPLASAASVIAARETPTVFTYRDIPYDVFDKKVNLLFNFAECL